MGKTVHKRFRIAERSYAALIKKGIKEMASELKFTEKREAEVDLIASELISNLLKHASHGGEILVSIISREDYKGLEIISVDSGPGIKEVKRMTSDGISTTKTLGHGLGSISRLSDEFDIYSVPEWGTVVLSRVWEKARKIEKKTSLEIGAVMVAKEKEMVCGDSWSFQESGKDLKIAVFDGLGHGQEAHIASEAAIDAFNNNIHLLPDQQLKIIHENIKKTRGAVGFILWIEKDQMNLIYSGVGNITGKCFAYHSYKNLISYNGTVGHVIPRTITNHHVNLSEFILLVIHSDGLKTKFDLDRHPGIITHHPSLIAACFYNDQNRGTDDATVVVVRINKNKM